VEPPNPLDEQQASETDSVQKNAIWPEIGETFQQADSRVEKGYEYEIKPGDSLVRIARAYSQAGVAVTIANILAANPGLDPTKLRVGQRIFVPATEQ
jgi:LysM repeat protein